MIDIILLLSNDDEVRFNWCVNAYYLLLWQCSWWYIYGLKVVIDSVDDDLNLFHFAKVSRGDTYNIRWLFNQIIYIYKVLFIRDKICISTKIQ